MSYVQRDSAGAIVGVFVRKQEGYAEEWLPDDDAAVSAFIEEHMRLIASSVSVSAFQAQAAMAQAQGHGITNFDLLARVEQIVSTSDDPIVPLAWNKATEFQRGSPTIAAIAAQVPLTSEQIDQLFQLAQTISA